MVAESKIATKDFAESVFGFELRKTARTGWDFSNQWREITFSNCEPCTVVSA